LSANEESGIHQQLRHTGASDSVPERMQLDILCVSCGLGGYNRTDLHQIGQNE
jgi:hypothetical protein